MTYAYKYSGDTTHPYVLFPMGKDYAGNVITISNIQVGDFDFEIVDTTDVRSLYSMQEEGFRVLVVTSGTIASPIAGTLYTRVGNAALNSTSNWSAQQWNNDVDFIIKPTTTNYNGNKQILSTPFLFYFGLRPGKTAVDKFIERFGPKGAFPSAE